MRFTFHFIQNKVLPHPEHKVSLMKKRDACIIKLSRILNSSTKSNVRQG